jgi:hypothetical protein
MFAKFAHLSRFGRKFGARFAAWPSNDNHPLRLVVAARRQKRNVLACHWRTMPSGTLECVWSGEGTDTPRAAVPEPQLWRLNGSPLLALRAA